KVISAVFISFTVSHIVYRALVMSGLITFEFDYFITIFMVLLIASVCYFAFVHSSVFNGTPIKRLIPFVKYEKTGLSPEFSLEMKERLLSVMDEERPFLNPDVRLDTIAKLLDVSRHHASQIINEHFSVNFFDFINKYRIKEAQRLLTASEPTLSITDIAFQSGFNNRISFYKAFKKILGTTPSDYREHTLAS
ncbi:MAG: helix-turn-helix domain-containing protein, partial [Flavobacteriaceae bacterium]